MKPILNDLDFVIAAQLLGCEKNIIKAFCKVEAPKGGFLPDDRPRILYEPFQFSNMSGHRFDNQVIEIDKIFYPLSLSGEWSPAKAKYGPESIQHYKLEAAKRLDKLAALKCCSWGKFQILAANHSECGYATAEAFVEAMYESEKAHLMAFVKKVQFNNKEDLLRNKDFRGIARYWNGPKYELNKYHEKIEAAYKSLQ